MRQIIACKFIRKGIAKGRDYSYFSEIPVEVGQKVLVPVTPMGSDDMGATKTVIVTAVNLPEDAIKGLEDQVKTIIGIAEENKEECSNV